EFLGNVGSQRRRLGGLSRHHQCLKENQGERQRAAEVHTLSYGLLTSVRSSTSPELGRASGSRLCSVQSCDVGPHWKRRPFTKPRRSRRTRRKEPDCYL